MVTYKDVLSAQQVLAGVIHYTPLTLSKTFSQMTNCSVYLKFENLQKTGAFKIRGAFNKIARLTQWERARGIVTASAGNHAQGVASAALHFRTPSTVVMPEGAPEAKILATSGYGAEVVLRGRNYDEAYEAAQSVAAKRGMTFVHAFDDPDVIAGQGTVGLEIFEELPTVDAIVVPVGGGGLISGIAVAAKALNPAVRIIGIQPEGSDSGFRSWQSGERRSIETPSSIADGLTVKCLGKLPFDIISRCVDEFITVSDLEIERAICYFLERVKMLVEGAGAIALAALLSGKLALEGQRVALVVSGGNIDLSKLTAVTNQFVARH